MTELLSVDKLSKRFGGLQAVQELSLSVHRGEILGLIGPNGAGKTTVFNLINGVHRPGSGRILFDGTDITGAKPHRIARLGLARTHQIVQPLMHMTVEENCMVGACFGSENLSLGRARDAAREAIAIAGLEHRATTLALHLTIGGKKRLELARALAARPQLMLLDDAEAGMRTYLVSLPRSATVEAPFAHKGAELVGVVSGLVQVLLGSGRPVLRRGETLLATRRGIDGWRNVGESEAQCLWVLRD